MAPIRVLITGAAGQIGYIIAGRVAHGDIFRDQQLILHLFDLPEQMKRLSGLVMELEDCAFPNLAGIVATDKPSEAFADVDYAIFLASNQLKPGQVRRDLLIANVPIFKLHGEWLKQFAKPSIRILLVANPVNTNCLVTIHYATNLTAKNFTCMSRLDHNRSRYELGRLISVPSQSIHKVISWGNHAESQVPDTSKAEYDSPDGRLKITTKLAAAFRQGEYVEKIRQRAWAVQGARGQTSALSAANAIVDHYRSWLY
jgi:malate dehydrogenase